MSLVLTIVNAWRPSFSRLQEVADFGSNPGALRMLTFLPENLSPRPALVVVLHGSMQSAADYDRGAGWSTLADQYGFALLMPEQSRQNNLTRSFNWFEPADTQREEGEAHSIMYSKALTFHVACLTPVSSESSATTESRSFGSTARLTNRADQACLHLRGARQPA